MTEAQHKRFLLYLRLYFVAGILVYGWAAADPCPISPLKSCGDPEAGYAQGMLAGMVWPLYLSTQVFKLVRQ